MATELATRPPAFVDGKTQSANDLRLNVLSGSGGATPLQSRAGVRPSGGNPGLVAALVTPVMKVRVNAGIADVPSTSVTGGFYRVSWDQVDLDIDPSSAQARTDLIIVEVVDTGTSAATGKVRVLKGTSGAGRPTNAVVNAHWWSLAAVAVRVNAEGTGNIRPQDVTSELQYAVAPGAPIPVSSLAERDALPVWDGRSVKRLDLGGAQEDRVSGSWQQVNGQLPAMRVYLSANQPFGVASYINVPFDAIDAAQTNDPGNAYFQAKLGATERRVLVKQSGLYLITYEGAASPADDNYGRIGLMPAANTMGTVIGSAGPSYVTGVSRTVRLAANDHVGAALNTLGNALADAPTGYRHGLSIVRLSS